MPIYAFRCPSCGREQETLMSYERSKTAEVICEPCSMAMVKLISLPAKTASLWGVDWRDGLSSNQFSHALGRKVTSKREEAKILQERGFVSENDLGKDWFDNTQAKQLEKFQEQDRRTETYTKTLAETGSKEMAIEKAFPAHECLDGTLDSIYDTSIKI